MGHVFWYTVEGPGRSLRDLRSIQDWYVRYQLNSVPGVAEVASVGGVVRQYQVDVDPNRLRAFRIPVSAVVDAVMRSNRNVGGNVVEGSGTWTVVRGLGLIESTRDLERLVLTAENGTPVYVAQVADVKVGDAFRVAALMKGTEEAVGGVVVARSGVSTVEVIARVKEKIAALQPGLPSGVRIVPFYDRSALIQRAVDTLKRALIEEIVVVTAVNVLFLLNVRSVLIVTIPLPLAVLIAFLFMRYLGISSNIMSLAGIAIAIGVLVDAAIVVTENCFRLLEQRGVNPRDRARVVATVLDASRMVGRPIFFSMAIILLAFIPVFALTGQEGKLFHPLAFTKTFAMAGATFLSVTLVPVLCALLIGGRIRGEERNPVMRPLVWLYRPLLGWALRHRVLTLGAAGLVLAGALALVPRFGREFMPPLNEGDLMFMPIADPAISLPQALTITRLQNEAIQKVPEVALVVAKIARADTSTDPAPLNMTETVVALKPRAEWRPGMTREKLIGELDAAATLPGVANIWTQPIINRINMLTTGIRSEVGVKVFGSDLKVLEERARAVADVLRAIPGAADVYPEQVTGAPYLDIRVKREAAARHGITPGTIQDVIETAIGETNLTLTIEGRQRFPVRVRYAPAYRGSAAALGGLPVPTQGGAQVPLAEVADLRQVSGPAMIGSENGLLVVSVLLNVRGRDVGSFIEEARRALAERVTLPPGSYLEWSGQYENELRARQRLHDSGARGARHHLRAALPDLSLRAGGGPRPARRAVRALGRDLPALRARLQRVGRRLGGLHRALRDGGANGGGHGDLPGGGGHAQARGARRAADACRAPGGGDGRRPAPPAPEGDDRLDHRGQPSSHHVERLDGRRGHEAAGHARLGRYGQLAGPCAAGHARHLFLAARARASPRGGRGAGGRAVADGGAADLRDSRLIDTMRHTQEDSNEPTRDGGCIDRTVAVERADHGGLGRRFEGDPDPEDQGCGGDLAQRVWTVDAGQEQLRPRDQVGGHQSAGRRRQGELEHQHADAGHGAHDRGGETVARQGPGTVPGRDQLPGQRSTPGHGDVGRAGGQGLSEVFRAGSLTAMRWLGLLLGVIAGLVVALPLQTFRPGGGALAP